MGDHDSYSDFSLSALLSGISRWRADAIFVVSPPLPLLMSARMLSRLLRVPYVLHVEDLQPDAAVDLGMIRGRRLTSALYALERMAYRGAASISTLNEAMANRIRAKGVAREKVLVLPHGADPDVFHVRETANGARFRHAHGLEDEFLVAHAGNMGVKQGLNVILDAAALSRDIPKIIYLLVGDGATRVALERRVADQNLSNVRFLPQLPRMEFHDFLAAADLSLVIQQRPVADILFPSKVETLMAAGQPILASLNGESAVARVLRDSGAGEVVEPEDPRALLDSILALRRERSRLAAMGARGQDYAREHWDRKRALELIEPMLAGARPHREVNETPASRSVVRAGSARVLPDPD
jgi:colanic acid biosynthesis glycosyl transferase WcaI